MQPDSSALCSVPVTRLTSAVPPSTRTVVVVSIAILVADYFLTRIFVAFLPA